MLYSSLFVAASAFAASASAQSSSLQYPNGPNGTTLSNPGQVNLATRVGWCDAERNTCPLLCGAQGWTANNCDANLLTYTCTCRSGATPNISDYAQTLPAFICQSDIDLCVANHPNDAPGQDNCRTLVCGTKNASAIATTSTSSSSASTTPTSSASSSSVSATTSPTPTGKSGSAGPLHVAAREYGTAALLTSLFAVFGFLA